MLEERFLARSVSTLCMPRPRLVCKKCYLDLLRRQIRYTSTRRLHPERAIRPPFSRSHSIANATTGHSPVHESIKRIGDSFFTGQIGRTAPLGSAKEVPSSGTTSFNTQEMPIPKVITRAKRRKQQQAVEESESISHQLPPDAASQLSVISRTQPPSSLRRIVTSCLALSKPRLSFLMILATATSYTLYPTPLVLLPEIVSTPSLSALTLLYLTSGTALCCACANSLNMYMEPQYDAKMARTRNRPLVRGLISTRVALIFAATTATLGIVELYFGVNPTTAFLGGLNIVLYAAIYTPLKRISVVNTWVGAVVGGIPPLMGWAAAAGQSATGAGDWQELLLGEQNLGGWLLAALLFAWQFPHFNALSWTIREEYKNAGYKMLCWVNPRRNGRVALRYAILLFPICWGLTYTGVTDTGFLVTSSVVNAWVLRGAIKFWRLEGHKGSARGLFWAGVWQLPLVMALAMFHKRGFWDSMWNRIMAWSEDDEDDKEFLFAEQHESLKEDDRTDVKVVNTT